METPNDRIAAILAELAALERREESLLADLAVQRGLLEIECASCGGRHAVKDLTAVQTHWYVSPHGCTGGDYWKEGEMQFVCPRTGVRNRLLFDNHDVPWDERNKYDNNPELQFRRVFRPLFREVLEEHDDARSPPWVNNHYVDRNRRIFGLVERRRAEAAA